MIGKLLAALGTTYLLVALTLSIFAAWQITQKQPELAAFQSGGVSTATVAPNPRASAARPPRPAVFYTAITERPLFSPQRRPNTAPSPTTANQPTPTAPTQQEAVPPDITLLGVMGGTADPSALVSANNAAPVWLARNGQIAGWTITQIGPDWLAISQNTHTLRIEMYPK